MVSNDFGLMYVLVVVGCNIVVIYGLSFFKYILLLMDKLVVVYIEIECCLCFKWVCLLEYLNCLN